MVPVKDVRLCLVIFVCATSWSSVLRWILGLLFCNTCGFMPLWSCGQFTVLSAGLDTGLNYKIIRAGGGKRLHEKRLSMRHSIFPITSRSVTKRCCSKLNSNMAGWSGATAFGNLRPSRFPQSWYKSVSALPEPHRRAPTISHGILLRFSTLF